jgi:hypothetical protein
MEPHFVGTSNVFRQRHDRKKQALIGSTASVASVRTNGRNRGNHSPHSGQVIVNRRERLPAWSMIFRWITIGVGVDAFQVKQLVSTPAAWSSS